jgi:hypothetical protein
LAGTLSEDQIGTGAALSEAPVALGGRAFPSEDGGWKMAEKFQAPEDGLFYSLHSLAGV